MMRTLITFILVWLPLFLTCQSLTGIIASFPFNGTAVDVSGNGNDGTISGPIISSDRFGYAGSAYQFDGVDDAIYIDDSPSLRPAGDFTFMAWFNPTVIKTADILRKNKVGVGGLAVYRLGISEANKMVVSLQTSESVTVIEHLGYNTNQWQLITGVVDGNSVTLYVDGVERAQSSFIGVVEYDTSRVIIGTRTNIPANTFQGRIDDVKIYDRALSSAEILAFFNQTCPDYLKLDNRVVNQNETHNARFLIELQDVTLNTPFDLSFKAPEILVDPQIEFDTGSDVIIETGEGCQ